MGGISQGRCHLGEGRKPHCGSCEVKAAKTAAVSRQCNAVLEKALHTMALIEKAIHSMESDVIMWSLMSSCGIWLKIK